ncbi:MAG: hypothetical protein WCR19_03000 [Acholeplasmataceae bacterium]
MKKILTSLTMSFVIFLLYACTSIDNSIELSVSNYETYINLSVFYGGDDAYHTSEYGLWYQGVEGEVEVEPDSNNYDFIDVVLKVQIIGQFTRVGYDSEPKKNYNQIINIFLNIDRFGTNSKVINIKDIYNSDYAKDIIFESYQVISVSGIVKQIR